MYMWPSTSTPAINLSSLVRVRPRYHQSCIKAQPMATQKLKKSSIFLTTLSHNIRNSKLFLISMYVLFLHKISALYIMINIFCVLIPRC